MMTAKAHQPQPNRYVVDFHAAEQGGKPVTVEVKERVTGNRTQGLTAALVHS